MTRNALNVCRGGEMQLEAIPSGLLHPPAKATEERRQRHNGPQDGEFKGVREAEAEKNFMMKNAAEICRLQTIQKGKFRISN